MPIQVPGDVSLNETDGGTGLTVSFGYIWIILLLYLQESKNYIILSDSTIVDLRTTRRRSRWLRSCFCCILKDSQAVFHGISLPGRSRSQRRRSSSQGSPNDRRRKMKENKESKEKPNREVKEPDGKVSPIPEKVAPPAPEAAAGAPQITYDNDHTFALT